MFGANRHKETKESDALVHHAFSICRELGIETLLVQIDKLSETKRVIKFREKERIAWVTMKDLELPRELKRKDILVHVPESPLTRVSQMKVALFFALTQDFVDLKKSTLFLSGAHGRLDTLMVVNPHRDFPWLQKQARALSKVELPVKVIERVIHCALRLSSEGREGRRVGTIFVIADPNDIKSYTHQLLMNPLEGHPKKTRSLHEPHFFETIRELTALDGAFIVSPSGIVESSGTFIGVQTHGAMKHVAGQGARHAAANALTARCKSAVAVVLSQSSGTVTVYHRGESILVLEVAHPTAEAGKN